ncbi:MAG: beta-hydroxyacyl-ACP dehydratase [Candidatus Aureabacteria bacterium]|nr:beta-hydroxyacyl-ACP dehydratase [Candidatus Auribacterota bacterium]
MRFSMIDRIVRYEAGKKIEAVKSLSGGEDYLADHFPRFPIMPGVLMLESMVQAASWLVLLSEGFSHAVLLIKEVSAIRYGSVLRPGEELRVEVELRRREGDDFSFKGIGRVGERNAVIGRFVLRRVPLGALNPELNAVDERIGRYFESQLSGLMEHTRHI